MKGLDLDEAKARGGLPTAEELVRRMQAVPPTQRGGCAYYLIWTGAALSAIFSATVATSQTWLPGTAVPAESWHLMTTLLILAGLKMRSVLRRAQATEAAFLLREGPKALPAFVELLGWPDRRVRDAARAWLTATLPHISEADAAGLSEAHRARLYDALNAVEAQRNPEFVTAVLRALPTFAGEGALGPLYRLRRLPGLTSAWRRVRQQALAVAEAVERRIYEMRLRARASGVRDVHEDAGEVAQSGRRVGFGEELGVQPQMRLGFLLAAWLVIVPLGLLECIRAFREGAVLEALGYALVAGAATQLHRVTLLGRHRRLVQKLLEEDDIRAVGRLAEAAVWPDERVAAAAISSLTRLLPRMTAGDAGLLTTAQREHLYSLLTRWRAEKYPEAAVAVLEALQKIGDVRAIRPVRELAEARGVSARMAAVKAAAQACLPVLLERARANTDPQVLLRPVEAPGPPAEMLLRPVEGRPSVDQSLLVQPASPPETDQVPERS